MEFAFVGTDTADEWKRWHGQGYEIVDDGIVLERDPIPTYVTPTPVPRGFPREFDVVDIAVDIRGVLFVLGASGDLFRYERERDVVQHLSQTPRSERGEPQALALTDSTVLVAYRPAATQDESATGTVRAVSRDRLREQWTAESVELPEFRPLEEPSRLVRDSTTRTIYLLDQGRKRDDTATPTGFVASVADDGTMQSVVNGLHRPADIAVDPAGALYVLAFNEASGDGETQWSPVVWRFGPDDLEGTTDPLTPEPRHKELQFGDRRLDAPAALEVGDQGQLLIGVGPETSNETALFQYRPVGKGESGETQYVAEQVASFTRSCRRLLLTGNPTDSDTEGLYAIDGKQRQAFFLPESRRYRAGRNEASSDDPQHRHTLISVFDSGVSGTHWHRLMVDIDVPDAGTQVQPIYYATDEESTLGPVTELDQVGPKRAARLHKAGVVDSNYNDIADLLKLDPRRIAEITETTGTLPRDWYDEAVRRFDEWWRSEVSPRAIEATNPRDALLDSAVGQYLYVGLRLQGNEFASPRVDSVRAYFPRQSYLQYLPSVFREDQTSEAFLERFLSLFETTFGDIEGEIADFTRHLDARGVPVTYLSWLEQWLAVETDETWSEAARREVLANAPDLYRTRGTRAGLLRLLRIYLEVNEAADSDEPERSPPHRDPGVGPYILEHSDLDRIKDPETRQAFERFLDTPQGFLAFVGPFLDDERVRTAKRIVDAERPAHASGQGVGLQPITRLGAHSYLGMNTVLSRPELVVGRTRLGEGSALREPDDPAGTD